MIRLPPALWFSILGAVVSLLGVGALDLVMRSPRAAGFWIDRLGAALDSPRGNEWGLARPMPWDGRGWPTAALRRIGPTAVPSCIEALQSEDAERRLGGALALALYGPAAAPAISSLVEVIQNDHSFGEYAAASRVRRKAIEAILQSGPGVAEARAALRSALRKPVPEDEAALVVRSVYQWPDPDARVRRIWAAYALGRLEPPDGEVFGVLTSGLTYTDAPYRAVHRDTYGGNEPPSEGGAFTVDGLAGYYFPRDIPVRHAALSALLSLGFESRLSAIDRVSLPPLVSSLAQIATQRARLDANLPERLEAISVIERIGPPARDAVPPLVTLLRESDDSRLRSGVTAALRAIDPAKR